MIDQLHLCHGMNFLTAYQGLEINLVDLLFHGIVINLLDQHVHGLPVHFQHHLAAFFIGLDQALCVLLCDLNRHGFFHLSAEDVAGHIAFSSQFLCFHIHRSFFSF